MTSSTLLGVRDAAAEDIETWLDLCAALFAEDAGTRDAYANMRWTEVYGTESFRAGLANPHALLTFAEFNGVPVGLLSGVFREPSEFCGAPTANLGSLYIRREFRGQAAGTMLVDRFKRWASELGARRLTVTAYAANEGAIRFYRQQGFAAFEATLAFDVAD